MESLEHLCRICLSTESNISIFASVIQEDEEFDVHDMFEKCTNLLVTEDDGLPNSMCNDCFFTLLKTNQFITKCQESDSILRSGKLIKTEEIDIPLETIEYKPEDTKVEEDILESKVFIDKNTCNICLKKFPSRRKVLRHMSTHNNSKPYLCEQCSGRFANSTNLKRHIRSCHMGLKPFVCKICGKGFTRSIQLIGHMNVHAGLKPYLCSICGKQFSHYDYYKAHFHKHSDHGKKYAYKYPEVDVQCKVCNDTFTSMSSLHSHMKIHNDGPSKFTCHVCGLTCTQSGSLKIHQRVHTGEKPYKCDVCYKQFAHLSTFKVHQLGHTGVKPYICHTCGKAFTQRAHLQIHLPVHSGIKAYKCVYCGRAFASQSNLKTHTKIHTGEKNHQCPVCEKGFYTTSGLKVHQKVHKEQTQI